MKKITKDIILDLLPLYLSGEASEDTKNLVEEFAAKYQEIAEIIRKGEIPVEKNTAGATLSEDLERNTLLKIRSNIRKQMVMVAMVTVGLLMIPFIAMQFTSEVNWTPGDFIVMGILLLATGTGYVLLFSLSGEKSYKIASGLAIFTAFVVIWVNLAVGIIGSENHPANRLYFLLLLLGILMAFIFRAKPEPMSRIMFSLGVLNFMIPIVAWFIWGRGTVRVNELGAVLAFNGIFSLMFLASGYFFKKAAQGN